MAPNHAPTRPRLPSMPGTTIKAVPSWSHCCEYFRPCFTSLSTLPQMKQEHQQTSAVRPRHQTIKELLSHRPLLSPVPSACLAVSLGTRGAVIVVKDGSSHGLGQGRFSGINKRSSQGCRELGPAGGACLLFRPGIPSSALLRSCQLPGQIRRRFPPSQV